MTEDKSIKCVVYGNGKKFKPKLFEPIKNKQSNKPAGGLWSSPIASKYGWKKAAADMSIGDFKTKFKIKVTGKILKIAKIEDIEKLEWRETKLGPFVKDYYPDFELLLKLGYVAIHLTLKGQLVTRMSYPKNLYGWDCETVFIMDENSIKTL